MINEARTFLGDSMEAWIDKIPNELPNDAIGFFGIVSVGRTGFGLSGDELVEWVQRVLVVLFEKGAKPVKGATDNIHYWTRINYGETNDEMIKAIIGEWQAVGEDPDAGGVWFALPRIYESLRSP